MGKYSIVYSFYIPFIIICFILYHMAEITLSNKIDNKNDFYYKNYYKSNLINEEMYTFRYKVDRILKNQN